VAEHLFDKFFRFSAERLTALGIPSDITEYLATVGLPEWCAPHTHFGPPGDPATELALRQIDSAPYLVLGEDRDGDLIALALGTYDVWVLPEGDPVYVASDVQELSASLHKFQACIDCAIATDSQAFVQTRVAPSHLGPFVSWAKAVNPGLIGHGSYWHRELVRLGLPPDSLSATFADGRP